MWSLFTVCQYKKLDIGEGKMMMSSITKNYPTNLGVKGSIPRT